ncbi:espin-like [Trifolium pratense]|uniref:espin-like n=1 Tax=Trifolium pratense TaxID=57577 RepID=UPI001E694B4F|nr:espin-like [Trifolium pratense]
MELSIMRNLYDASLKGCVSTLKKLIEKDTLILSRVSLYPNFETPLHIASLLGHIELCRILLDISPNLAAEVNSEGQCPLHLASAKGHIEIVKFLLLTNAETCFIHDKDDKLPLHFAVMRGRLGVIKELIGAMPETEIVKVMTEINDHGSVLHLCVCYNQLEAMKILVESIRRGDIDQILSSKDKEGNTVLDLAVKQGQIKIIKFLLSPSEMSESETINTSKSEASRALDMLEHYPIDFISHTTQHILVEERAQTSSNIVIAQQDHITSPNNDPQQLLEQQLQINGHEQSQTPSPNNDPQENLQPSQNIDPPQPPQSLPINHPLQQAQSPISHPLQLPNPSPQNDSSQPSSHNPSPSNNPQHRQSPSPHNDPSQPSLHNDPLQPPPPFLPSNNPSQPLPTPRWDKFENFCKTYIINQGNWITKEQLMVAATVIATMAFQSVINPPGGVWQEDTTTGAVSCPDYGFCEAGTAVVGYVWSPVYLKFIYTNSVSFFPSLCVLLVLISGLPLHNKVMVWILVILMVVAITSMLFTYTWALALVSPNHIFNRVQNLAYIMVIIWVFLLIVVSLIPMTRFLLWARSRRRSSPN